MNICAPGIITKKNYEKETERNGMLSSLSHSLVLFVVLLLLFSTSSDISFNSNTPDIYWLLLVVAGIFFFFRISFTRQNSSFHSQFEYSEYFTKQFSSISLYVRLVVSTINCTTFCRNIVDVFVSFLCLFRRSRSFRIGG